MFHACVYCSKPLVDYGYVYSMNFYKYFILLLSLINHYFLCTISKFVNVYKVNNKILITLNVYQYIIINRNVYFRFFRTFNSYYVIEYSHHITDISKASNDFSCCSLIIKYDNYYEEAIVA